MEFEHETLEHKRKQLETCTKSDAEKEKVRAQLRENTFLQQRVNWLDQGRQIHLAGGPHSLYSIQAR